MKFTIITPTNTSPKDSLKWKYLKECCNSVLAQTHGDWQWVLLVNGEGDVNQLPPDPRILVFKTDTTGNVGKLKKEACSHGSGDVIVELDHDDMLTPDCLAELAIAFSDPSLDFAYSNCAEFFSDHDKHADWEPQVFNPYYGWKHRDFFHNGIHFKEMVAFDPSPASLGLIYYAPNHVRAWRRTSYRMVGGHNEQLCVIDDQELAIRFYLSGKMRRIDKCLYLYRIHGRNSWLQMNNEVQKNTREMQSRYIYQLSERFCDLRGWKKLDLGGAFYPPRGYETVDIRPGCTYQMDLNDKHWDLPDNSFGLVRAFDLLEHLKDPINTMNNIHRILKPGGIVITMTPSTDGRGAWCDPTHVSYWNATSFLYYSHRNKAQFIRPQSTARFQTMRRITAQTVQAENIHHVYWDGIALKPGMRERFPGEFDWDIKEDIESLLR